MSVAVNKMLTLHVAGTTPTLDWTKLLVFSRSVTVDDAGETANFTPVSGDMHIFNASVGLLPGFWGFATIDVVGQLIHYTGPATNCQIDVNWVRGTLDHDAIGWVQFSNGGTWFQMDFDETKASGPYSHSFTVPSGLVTPVSFAVHVYMQATWYTTNTGPAANWSIAGNIHNL